MGDIVVADNVRLHVQDVGSGRPVVLLSGWGMDHEVFDQQVRVLSGTNRVICVDLRGHGFSAKPVGDYSIGRHALDVAEVLDHLDLTDVAIAGWSMGGQVAFALAADRPDRISQLVLLGSNAVRLTHSEEFPFGMTAEQFAPLVDGELTDRPAFRQSISAGCFYAEPHPSTLAWVISCSMRTPSWAGAESLRSMAEYDQVHRIGDIQIPVLQIHGVDDAFWPIDGARWLSKQLSHATLVEIEQCGHLLFLERPERCTAALLNFITDRKESR